METRSSFEPESLLAHAGWLRALAASLVVDPGAADDVVQDTWVAALQRRPSAAQPLAPWLSRVVRNLASKRRRGDARRGEREARANDTGTPPTPAQTAEQLELQRVLLEALLAVEEPLRTTLFLRYFQGRTSAEIARAQDVPAGTVRWRLKRGLDELRELLDKRFGGERASWCAAFAPLVARDATVLTAASAGSLAGAAAPGVLVMSVVWKIAAVAAVVVAGGLWLARDSSERAATRPSGESGAVEAPREARAKAVQPDARAGDAAAELSNSRRALETAEVAKTPEVAAAAVAANVSAATIDVRFVDAAGTPWSGVRFTQLSTAATNEARSDERGRAELHVSFEGGDGSERPFEFHASREGCSTALLRARLSTGANVHLGDVVLGAGANLHGRVLDENGVPLDGARVGLTNVKLPSDDEERLHRQGDEAFDAQMSTASGTGGAFELTGVAAGPWRLWGYAEGHRFAWSEPIQVVAGTDQFGLELVVPALAPTDRIEGRVLDPYGEPVAKALIELAYTGEHEMGSTSVYAGDDGRFRIVIFVPGTYCLLASDPDGRYAKVGAPALKPGMLDVVVRLAEQRFVDVRVLDADGRPVVRAKVFLGTEDHGLADEPASVPEGRRDPRVSIPMHPFVLVADAPGFRRKQVGPFEPSAVDGTVDITMERLPGIRGRVVAAGQPLAGALVELRAAKRISFNGFDCHMAWQAQTATHADADGRFELGCELEGDLWIVASADGWARAELGPLHASDATSRGDVELELTHGGAIEGRVLMEGGKSGEGAIVGINHGDAQPRTQRAGPNGVFRFDGLAPGKWQVSLRDVEMTYGRLSISDAAVNASEIAWTCEVVAGRTTRYDLDATRR